MKFKQKLLKTGRRGEKNSFPFLSHDKLDPNVYPSSAKQQPLPASEFCRARCWGPAVPSCLPCRQRGSEDKHLLRPLAARKSFSLGDEGAKRSSFRFTAAQGRSRHFLCPQSASWFVGNEISFVSLKATLREHKTSAENSPRSPTQFFSFLSRANGTLFTPCPL